MPAQSKSGVYERTERDGAPFTREKLRLDVDGEYPLMAASGTGYSLNGSVHWVAPELTLDDSTGKTVYSGQIQQRFGLVDLFPFDHVVLHREPGALVAVFSATNRSEVERRYQYRKPYFREVAFEFDVEEGVEMQLEYRTHSHPDHPGSIPDEQLNIDTIFERAGFLVTRTRETSTVSKQYATDNPAGCDEDAAWCDAELQDAMHNHFSRLESLPENQRDLPQWALWTFFASQHQEGPTTGGKMFDQEGAGQRQGTAVFMDSFISNPGRDPHPKAWKERMAFWSAVHEMGHGFNLMHTWDKTVAPWRAPKEVGFDVLSFMNYPRYFGDGLGSAANVARFFQRFEYRFTWDELLFLRHAPEHFVQMGNESFGSNHALELAEISPVPDFELKLRVNRAPAEFGFLEPVVVELRLKNISDDPQLIPEGVLEHAENLTIVVRKRHKSPMVFDPFVKSVRQPKKKVLMPGEAVYASHFISVGSHGWMVAEPGYYQVRACLHFPKEDVLSEPLRIRVTPPRNWDEEYVAQDFFDGDVARVLTFDGSKTLSKANAVLEETMQKCPKRNVALHAQVALKMPYVMHYKQMQESGGRYHVQQQPMDEDAVLELKQSLGNTTEDACNSSQILSNIDFFYYAERLAAALTQVGQREQAAELLQRLDGAGKKRKVLRSVRRSVREKMRSLLEDDEED